MDRQEGEEGRLEVAAFITAVAVSLEKCSRGRVGTTCVCRRDRWGGPVTLQVQGGTLTSFQMLKATLISQSA